MAESSSAVLDRPDTREDDTTEPGKMAHIVIPKSAVTEAYIKGTPIEALCGKVWVPSRDPENLPVCQKCKDIQDELMRDIKE